MPKFWPLSTASKTARIARLISERRLHNSIQPACRLPHELCAEVFEYDCADPGHMIAMSQVCSHFRAAAISFRYLWRNISVRWKPVHSKGASSEKALDHDPLSPNISELLTYLVRSGEIPLNVTFSTFGIVVDAKWLDAVWNVLLPHFSRCYLMDVSSDRSLANNALPLLATGPMLLTDFELDLTIFSIFSMSSDLHPSHQVLHPLQGDFRSLTTLNIKTPNHKSLHLRFAGLHAPALRELKIAGDVGVTEMTELLSQCAATLEVFVWTSYKSDREAINLPLTFPRLHKLQIIIGGGHFSLELRYWTAPVLKELLLDAYSNGDIILNGTSFPSLEHALLSPKFGQVSSTWSFLTRHPGAGRIVLFNNSTITEPLGELTLTMLDSPEAVGTLRSLLSITICFLPRRLLLPFEALAAVRALLVIFAPLKLILLSATEGDVQEDFMNLRGKFPRQVSWEQWDRASQFVAAPLSLAEWC